jgi:putative ABC transport system substrate-binding protein
VRRREILVLGAGTAIALPLTGRAQQGAIPLVGVLRTATAVNDQGIDAFRHALRQLGYVEGQSIRVEVRWSGGDNESLPALAAELAALKPDVIVANGERAISVIKDAAANTPIVMSIVGDPVAAGFAQNLAHPGGNLTGLTNLGEGLAGKRLELLLQVMPKPGCVGVLTNPDQKRLSPAYSREANVAAQSLGVDLWDVAADNADQFEAAIAEAARRGCRALLGGSDPIFTGARGRLLALVARHRIAAIYDTRWFVDDGGLMSYGPDLNEMIRRAALYVDKILKGAKPGDLPIELPTKFELVINLKTAKALGLMIPQSMLARADEVIE